MDFSHSPKAQEMIARVQAFMDEHIIPREQEYLQQVAEHGGDWTRWRVPPLMEEWKAKARAQGLWNLFLPDAEYGAGLSNRDYAPLAEIMGYCPFASEAFNCSAPALHNRKLCVIHIGPLVSK